jgi:flagellar protein FlaG
MINLMNAVPIREQANARPEVHSAADRQPASATGNPSPATLHSPTPQLAAGENFKAAVEQVSVHLERVATSLSISVDEGIGSTVIQVKDKATDEVIRQIPPEQIVNLARFLRENSGVNGFELADTMKGLLVDSSE